MTIIKKIFLTVLLLVVLVPTTAVIFIQLPPVQTFLCNTVVKKLSGVLDGNISIGKIYISLPNNIIVKDVVVTQENECDTVAHIGKLLVHAGTTTLISEHAHIHRIAVENGFVKIDRISKLVKKSPAQQTDTTTTVTDTLSTFKYKTITLDKLHIADMAASMMSSDTSRKRVDRVKRPRKVDWKEFSFSGINLDLNKIHYDDSLTAIFKNLQVKEEHGWDVNTFKCGLTMTDKAIKLSDFQYNDGYSNLVANHLNMEFESLSKFSDFCHNVSMDVDFNNTLLDFNSLAFFGCTDHLKLKLFVTGRVVGPVSRLKSEKLTVCSGTQKTRLELVPNIIGLPKSKTTMASVKVKGLTTNMADIAQIVSEVTKSKKFKKENIARFAPGETITFNGSLDGLFTDFVAHGNLNTTSMGNLDVDIICRTDKGVGYTIDGYMQSNAFDVGTFLQNDKFGKLSCDGALQIITGQTKTMSIDHLTIFEAGFGERTYNDIDITGQLSPKRVDIDITSDDDWIKFGSSVSMFNTDPDNMEMEMNINSLQIFDTLGVHDGGNIRMFASSHPNGSYVELESKIANFTFQSEIGLGSYIKKLKAHDYVSADSRITVTLEQINPIVNAFLPDCFIEPGTEFQYGLTNNGRGYGYFKSNLIAMGNKYIKGLNTRVNIDTDNNVSILLAADTIQVGEVIAKTTSLDFEVLNKEDFTFSTRINNSHFDVGDVRWNIDTRSLNFKKNLLCLDSLRIFNENHYLAADGVLGKAEDDTLKLEINNLDISKFNSLLGKNITMSGILNGNAEVISFFGEKKGCIADIRGDSLSFNGDRYGQLDFLTEWNQEQERFDISLVNTMEKKRHINISGYYRPGYQDMDITAELDSMGLSFIEPFAKSAISGVSGSVDGNIHLTGGKDSLNIESRGFAINDAEFNLLYTQVRYGLSGPLAIDNNGLHLDSLVIKDREGHEGHLSGGLTYKNLKNIQIDTRISINNMMGLNTSLANNSSFYGKAYATGLVRLSGSPDNMSLSIKATTNENTSVHIPISSYGKEQTSILKFRHGKNILTSSYDSLRLLKNLVALQKTKKKNMAVNLDITATRDAELMIEIDRTTGDILKTRGDGNVAISAGGSENKFNIKGNYVVNSGSFKFTLVGGILSRDFSIAPGGTISMSGDIMKSQLDLMAKYRTKASLSSLIQDTTASGARRTVDCGIGFSGLLSNPQLSFSVDIPDLDPSTLGRVESALNTEEKRMKQVLALLLSGSFVPDQEGGIVNSTTVLYSNVSEIMSNQFNNIFRQLEIPLDLGFKYQPTNDGRDMFDVAVSTQLFNNRVTINGNIGNRTYSTSSSSKIVGDIDVEIKINKSGKLLLNVFSHSADQYSNYLDQAQRNGAGVVFQEEFDTFKELWRNIFWSKKRREEEAKKTINAEKENEQQK